jgi:hypothetical protein
LSFAVPAEDLPETAYDESETLPYEMTATLSAVVQESALTLQALPVFPSDLFSASRHASCRAGCRERAAHPIADSLVVLDRLLRC